MKDDMMPQLMPFMWIGSVFMFMYMIMMLVNMYYYKNNGMIKQHNMMLMNSINYTW